MSKYRKKPIVIEAVQFTGGAYSIRKIVDELKIPIDLYEFTNGSDGEFHIYTLEGTHRADVGDWIVKGIKGEFYPVKPEIFEVTYEKVDE